MKRSFQKTFFVLAAVCFLGFSGLAVAGFLWFQFSPYRDGWPSRAHSSPLHSAVIADDLAAVRSAAPSRADAQEQLFYARSEAMAEYLISRGASATALRDDFTPLHFAAALGSEEVARVLLRHGADVNAATGDGRTPLMLAAACSRGEGDEGFDGSGYDKTIARRIAVTRLLIAAGATVNQRDTGGRTALFEAISGGGAHDVVAVLIDAGADVTIGTVDDLTPLHEAAYSSDLETVRLLLAHGANVDIKEWQGKYPIDCVPKDGEDAPEIKRLLTR